MTIRIKTEGKFIQADFIYTHCLYPELLCYSVILPEYFRYLTGRRDWQPIQVYMISRVSKKMYWKHMLNWVGIQDRLIQKSDSR